MRYDIGLESHFQHWVGIRPVSRRSCPVYAIRARVAAKLAQRVDSIYRFHDLGKQCVEFSFFLYPHDHQKRVASGMISKLKVLSETAKEIEYFWGVCQVGREKNPSF